MQGRNLIEFLERDRADLKISILWLSFLMAMRFFFDVIFLKMEIGGFAHFLHFISYYFYTFSFGVIFLSILSKETPRKVFNICLIFYPLILTAPLLDSFLFHRTMNYEYISIDELFTHAPTLFLFMKNTSFGIIIEGMLMGILSFTYVLIKTKKTKFSIFRGFLAFLTIYLIFAISSTPSLYIPPEFRIFQEDYVLFYLSISVIFLFLLIRMANSEKFFALVKNFRFIRTSHFLLLVLLGALLVSDKVNITLLLSSILATFFIRQFSIILNDIFDLEIDKISNKERPLVSGIITKNEFLDMGLLFLILSLLYTILIKNSLALLLVLLSILLVIVYSAPPLRLRNTIFSSSLIGLGSSLAFLFGYVSQRGELGTTILSLGILIFLAVSLGGVIKDRKDYEGDKEGNVRTIYTIFGPKRSRRISLVLIALSFLLPLFLFHQKWHDFLFFAIAALSATIDFKRNENHERILFYAFLVFLYCFLRLKFGIF